MTGAHTSKPTADGTAAARVLRVWHGGKAGGGLRSWRRRDGRTPQAEKAMRPNESSRSAAVAGRG